MTIIIKGLRQDNNYVIQSIKNLNYQDSIKKCKNYLMYDRQ